MNRTVIVNGKLILPNEISKDSYVIITDSKISKLGKGKPEISHGDIIIDAQNNYISPGFIDIHTHGAGGADFMDATTNAFLTIAATHAKYGTTGLLATTLASSDEELFHTFDIYKQAKKLNREGAKFLGIHLEGPYFSHNQRGAQDPKYIKNPVPEDYLKILQATNDIVRWSIAPELQGALELGKILASRNIIASVAHTDALCEEVIEAFGTGYSLMTHLYSAMSTVTRKNAFRYAGAVEAAYLLDKMDVEIIADGIHLPKSLLQFVYKFKGPDRTALVTDSMRAAGMPNGIYALGSLNSGRKVLVEDGVAKLMDKSAFAGSIATSNRLIKTMVNLAEVPLVDAVKMMSITPARILRLNNEKGSLTQGKDADILIFDENINIKLTMIEGIIVHKS